MKIIPQNDYVLCRYVSPKQEESSTELIYKVDNAPLYEVLDVSMTSQFKIGDIVIAYTTGTRCKVDDKEYFLFKSDAIAGKVIE